MTNDRKTYPGAVGLASKKWDERCFNVLREKARPVIRDINASSAAFRPRGQEHGCVRLPTNGVKRILQ